MQLGPPTFLFTQFGTKVHLNGDRYLVIRKGHLLSHSQAWQELLELRYEPILAHYGLTDSKYGLHLLKSGTGASWTQT